MIYDIAYQASIKHLDLHRTFFLQLHLRKDED